MLQPFDLCVAQSERLLQSSRYLLRLLQADLRTARECVESSKLAIEESLANMARSDRMMEQSNYFTAYR